MTTSDHRANLEIENIIADIRLKNQRRAVEAWKFGFGFLAVGLVIGAAITQGVHWVLAYGSSEAEGPYIPMDEYIIVEPKDQGADTGQQHNSIVGEPSEGGDIQ